MLSVARSPPHGGPEGNPPQAPKLFVFNNNPSPRTC
jgi:hypothetical protein